MTNLEELRAMLECTPRTRIPVRIRPLVYALPALLAENETLQRELEREKNAHAGTAGSHARLREENETLRRERDAVDNWRCVGPDAPQSDCRAGGADLEEMCVACAAHELHERWESVRKERDAAREALEAFVTQAEVAVRHHENRGKGGMQVPYHGDFANIPPSVVGQLRWWIERFRAALTPPKPEATEAAKGAPAEPCRYCIDDGDPVIAARERIALGLPPRGTCCEWSKTEAEKGAEALCRSGHPNPPGQRGCMDCAEIPPAKGDAT